jgi:hypothetical protein
MCMPHSCGFEIVLRLLYRGYWRNLYIDWASSRHRGMKESEKKTLSYLRVNHGAWTVSAAQMLFCHPWTRWSSWGSERIAFYNLTYLWSESLRINLLCLPWFTGVVYMYVFVVADQESFTKCGSVTYLIFCKTKTTL